MQIIREKEMYLMSKPIKIRNQYHARMVSKDTNGQNRHVWISLRTKTISIAQKRLIELLESKGQSNIDEPTDSYFDSGITIVSRPK